MAGILVEYGRFVEVQERRVRVLAELIQPQQDLASPSAYPTTSQEPSRPATAIIDVEPQRRAPRGPADV